jgi:hypothetical protein
MIVHQALHGYANGHALLARSVELTPDERRDLDELSDQSGTVGRALHYEHYDTGYPTGRWYVYARTWIDDKAERRGTVWTHSLLIPIGAVEGVASFAQLAHLFKRPSRPMIQAEWSSVLGLPESKRPAPPSPLREPALRSLLSAWFFRDARPLLWEDPSTADAAVEALWTRLPPAQRRAFTFCSYSIQPRTLRGQIFDWMTPAPDAGGAWHRVRTSSARVPVLEDATPAGLALLVRGGGALAAVWARWPDAVAALPPNRLRLLLRYVDLEARRDYAGALSRLDCVEGLRESGKALAAEAVDSAFAALESADRVSWSDVRQLTIRAPHRLDPAHHDDIRNRLFALILQRVDPRSEGFDSLAEAAEHTGLATLVDDAVVQRERTRGVQDTVDDLRNLGHFRSRLALILDAHPHGNAIAARCLETTGSAPDLSHQVRSWVTADLDRAQAVFGQWTADAAIVTSLLSGGASGDRQQWDRVLRQVESTALLPALATTLPDDTPRTAALASSLARLPINAIVSLPPSWLSVVLNALFDDDPARLSGAPAIAADLLKRVPRHASANQLVERLCKENEPSVLTFLLEPNDAAGNSWAVRWADTVLAEHLQAWLDDRASNAPAWAALASDRALHALAPTLAACEDAALARAFHFVREVRGLQQSWVLDTLWKTWSRRSADATVAAVPEWAGLLDALHGRDQVHQIACSVAFARAIAGSHRDFGVLAAASFPTVHGALINRESRNNFLSWIEAFWGIDWDKAKHVRRRAAAEWVRQRWSAEVLVLLADRDRSVFEKLWETVCDVGGASRRSELTAYLPSGWERGLRER